jgi:hypothetical protein
MIKMLCEFQDATIVTNVIGAFRKAGIVSRWDEGHGKLMFFIDRENASDIRHEAKPGKITLEAFPRGP